MIENAEAVARETYRFVPLSAPAMKVMRSRRTLDRATRGRNGSGFDGVTADRVLRFGVAISEDLLHRLARRVRADIHRDRGTRSRRSAIPRLRARSRRPGLRR